MNMKEWHPLTYDRKLELVRKSEEMMSEYYRRLDDATRELRKVQQDIKAWGKGVAAPSRT